MEDYIQFSIVSGDTLFAGTIGRTDLEGGAKKLLKESKLSMAEIAEQVGYSTARYFSARFKIHTGVSPLAYRKKRLKGL